MTQKHSVHEYVANVFFKGGTEREVHYDNLVTVRHGFLFARADGSGDFINGDTVDSFDVVRASKPMGSA